MPIMPPEPYWMMDTTEGVPEPQFHALESYLDAVSQKPALCGYQMIEASDFIRPGNNDAKLCPKCVVEVQKIQASRAT